LIGKPFKTLTPKTDMIATQDLPRKSDRFDTQLVRVDGSTLEVAMTSTPIFMQDGKRRRVVIIRDITQEAAMKRQKEYFFARASHELRTPLTNIMTRLYLLERDPQQGVKHLSVLNKVSRQMLTLLNDLLSVARLENGIALEKRMLDLQDVLRDVVEVQQSDAELKHVSLVADLPDIPFLIYADPTRINQVFTNLIRNAVIYTPDGGCIEVSATISEDSRSVVVRVSDNGIGIEPAHLPRLFDPFFRATEGGVGAGLGLYITREIIDLHGGTIEVESTPGVGTTFGVRLNLHKEPKPLLLSS
jgi:signal transduction histidine kinase